MTNEQIQKLTLYESRYPLSRLPVCGHCEKLAFWHKDGTAYCPSCGTYTQSPITYSTYLASGYDIDATTAGQMLKMERDRKSAILPDYGE